MNGGGDALARGGKSAQFGPPKVTAERWAEIWKDEPFTITDLKNIPVDDGTPKITDIKYVLSNYKLNNGISEH